MRKLEARALLSLSSAGCASPGQLAATRSQRQKTKARNPKRQVELHSRWTAQASCSTGMAAATEPRLGFAGNLGLSALCPSATAGHLGSFCTEYRKSQAPASPEHPGSASPRNLPNGEMLTTEEGSQFGYNQRLLFDEGA